MKLGALLVSYDSMEDYLDHKRYLGNQFLRRDLGSIDTEEFIEWDDDLKENDITVEYHFNFVESTILLEILQNYPNKHN